ncbi:hypothetical protein OHB04_01765 [Streptomyces sp. NBC_01775]|nr:BTAD domain-containing putative transcriptional regulator [Streptomyces sp. NBC_01775]WSB74625.1 hypothetical protein OHB04_01765 [Streptomyces sp. NBC_01775]
MSRCGAAGIGSSWPSCGHGRGSTPLDERLAGHLMLALYRCGRAAEALDHCRSTRVRLADELGIDPGDPLQRLHQRILSADPTWSPAPPTPHPPPPPAPPGPGRR